MSDTLSVASKTGLSNVTLVRSYLFEYIVGVLWLSAFAMITASQNALVSLATALRKIVVAFGGATPPEIVIGFALALAGVVVPFCVALVCNPISYLIMNATAVLRSKVAQQVNPASSSNTACVLCGNVHSSSFTFRLLLLLRHGFVDVVVYLIRVRDEFMLRANAIVPASLLVGAAVWRGLAALECAGVIATVVAVAIFVIGAWDINDEAQYWRGDVITAACVLPPASLTSAAPVPEPATVPTPEPAPAPAPADVEKKK